MRKSQRFLWTQLKSFLLVLLVGTWGGSLVKFLTGDPAVVNTGYASSVSNVREGLRVLDVEYNLDPGNPVYLRSMEIQTETPAHAAVSRLMVNLTGNDTGWSACYSGPSDTSWHCPVSGVALRDAVKLEVRFQ